MVQGAEGFAGLWAHFVEVLAVCRSFEVEPVLTSSLAVAIYRPDAGVVVADIDAVVPEGAFGAIAGTARGAGMGAVEHPGHVLELTRGDFRVDLDAGEHWLPSPIAEPEWYDLWGEHVLVASLADVTELYRSGAEALAARPDAESARRRARFALLLAALGTPDPPSP